MSDATSLQSTATASPASTSQMELHLSQLSTSHENLTPKQLQAVLRRERDKLRARERRKNETVERRKQRQEKCRLAQAIRRKDETEDQRQKRLMVDRERAKRRRMKESNDQKASRLERNRIRTAIRRKGIVSNVIDAFRIYNDDAEVKELLLNEGYQVQQVEEFCDDDRITLGLVNQNEPGVFYKMVSFRKESDDQKKLRLQRGRQYAAKRRQQETSDQRERRLLRERLATQRRRKHQGSSQSGSVNRSGSSVDTNSPPPSSHNMDMEEMRADELELDGPVSDLHETRSPSVVPSPQTVAEPDFQLHRPVPVAPLSVYGGTTAMAPRPDVVPVSEMELARTAPETSTAMPDFPPPNSASTETLPWPSLLSAGGLGMPSFGTPDMSLLEFSQIYSALQPPTTSLSVDSPCPWPPTAETALKDKSDYLIQNLGLVSDTSVSPMTSSNLFNNLPPPQPIPPPPTIFQNPTPVEDPNNSMSFSMLLRNFSNPPPVIDTFTPNFNSRSFLSASLGIRASPSSVFGSTLELWQEANNINQAAMAAALESAQANTMAVREEERGGATSSDDYVPAGPAALLRDDFLLRDNEYLTLEPARTTTAEYRSPSEDYMPAGDTAQKQGLSGLSRQSLSDEGFLRQTVSPNENCSPLPVTSGKPSEYVSPQSPQTAVDSRAPLALSPLPSAYLLTIVQNSCRSFVLLLQVAMQELSKAHVAADHALLTSCPDESYFPNLGLHLVVSLYLVETEWPKLRNRYYASLCRLMRVRESLDDARLYGSTADDQSSWSEMYDTFRALHLEIFRVLRERTKNDTVDTSCFNAVERAELSIKRAQSRRAFRQAKNGSAGVRTPLGNPRFQLAFLDYVLIELLDFLDHIAQISWMVFPCLAQERLDLHASPAFRQYRHESLLLPGAASLPLTFTSDSSKERLPN